MALEETTLIFSSLLDTETNSPRLFVLLSTLMCSFKNFSYS